MVLLSKWGKQLDEKSPLQDYPRMQLQRDSYFNLNGVWEYQITGLKEEPKPGKWKKIIVPFALGSKLSGADDILQPNQALWYRKQFAYKPSVAHTWLNFEAVDQVCTVYLNGIKAGSHIGGYAPFSLDITDMIKYQNSLMVKCTDDSDMGILAYGKQKLDHSGMWYTPSAGIWQSVWIEDLNEHAIHDLKITPDYDEQKVYIDLAGNFSQAAITIGAAGEVVHRGLTNDMHYEAPIDPMHPWTPEDPFLYDLYIQTEDDVVKSYFGMRKFSVGHDADGTTRFCLNNKPLFLSGLLDQGYTVDGLMTYPDEEAITYELAKIKEMGFNMLRKHVKVECRQWYYNCDKLGILVMQDMPSGGKFNFREMGIKPTLGFRHQSDIDNPALGRSTEDEKQLYYHELDEMLDNLYNFTSLFAWVPFNEGWGQFDSAKVTEHIRDYDATRLIDSASGWHDQGAGDFDSIHDYFFPFKAKKPKDERILILSEFGGYSYVEHGHSEPQKTYGYRKFSDRIDLDSAVNKLYEKMILNNIKNGLSGCIYTQVSDVEDECNGLFTADREIVKIDIRKMKRMNEKLYRRCAK